MDELGRVLVVPASPWEVTEPQCAQPTHGCLTFLSKVQSNWPVSFPSEVFFISNGIQKDNRVESGVLKKQFCMYSPWVTQFPQTFQFMHFKIDFSDHMVLTRKRRSNVVKSLKVESKEERLLVRSCHVEEEIDYFLLLQKGQTRKRGESCRG